MAVYCILPVQNAMHIYNDILSFVSNYGYLGVFLGAVLEGETLIMISGFLVHEKYLLFVNVLFYGFLGAVVGDLTWFLLGKYKGNILLSKWPWLKRVSQKPVGYITRKPALVSFWVRFIYGFRHIIPFTLGMSGYPTRLFMFWNSLGAMFWVTLFTSGGFLLGNILESFLGHLKRYQLVTVLLVIIIIVIFNLLAKLFKKSVESAVKE